MDATRHGLFRRLRRRTSRASLAPDPHIAPPSVVQSPWLRAAFGLEVEGMSRAMPLMADEAERTPATSPPVHAGGGLAVDEWPAAEQIVEPAWIFEPEQD